jgi:pyruvate ferredoxin oxidoreductase gamma subunit/phenylglyoxylate dehydrogenase gamma subunit
VHEVRIHGRGGQGAVIASKVLAKALVEEGKYVTAIPSFGFERRGAPVAAFLRFDDKEIRANTNIYHPDCIICIDPTIARVVDIFAGMTDAGTLVQATKRSLEGIDAPDTLATVGLCDAVGIALEIFRKPITNSIMLGAFARTTGVVSLEALKQGLESANLRDAGLRQNIEAIERGYDETVVHELDREAPS